MTTMSLTDHDRAVLNCVFNPNLPLDDAYDEKLPHLKDEEEENTPENLKSRQLELDGIKKADEGNLTEAIKLLTQAAEVAPNRASVYNNRTQVHRLLGNTLEALSDATKAIELSQGKGRTGCQAYCQRGMLHRKAGRNELAKDDFTAASELGSKFAKSLLIDMNPYAALCNQMLRQAMDKL